MTYLKSALIALMLLTVQARAGEIQASKMVDKGYRTTIKNDLKNLQNFAFRSQADDKTLKVMGLDELSAKSAKRWLEKRVQWIIKNISTDKLNQRMSLNQRNWEYPLPNRFPILNRDKRKKSNDDNNNDDEGDEGEEEKGVAVMSNIGTMLYFYGKQKKTLYNFAVPNKIKDESMGKGSAPSYSYKKVPIATPRVGLIRIGKGLFMERFQANTDDRDDISNSILRLGTFFHEARHSDGHGRNLGFFHATCPEDHDLAGLKACDRTLNGSYAVGGQMIKEMLKNCRECTKSEKTMMTLRYIDSLNRIIEVSKKEIDNVEENIKGAKRLIERKKNALKDPNLPQEEEERIKTQLAKLKKLLKKYQEAKEQGYIEVHAKHADPAPEGERL